MRDGNRQERRLRPVTGLNLGSLSLILCILICGGEEARAGDEIDRLEGRLQALEQEVQTLRREIERIRQAEQDEPPIEQARETPTASVEVGRSGATLSAADGSLAVRLRGYFQTDSRVYLTEDSLSGSHSFLMRRARPVLELTAFQDFEFRLMPDFGGSSASLFDAYFNWRVSPQFQVRAGKAKSPTGLERLQSATALAFMERGLPTHLLPNRDVGVQVHGSLLSQRLTYAVGLFNGTRDGSSAVTDGDDGKDVAVRIFAHPFTSFEQSPLKGLGVGISATRGRHEGPPSAYSTGGQQQFFRYRPGVVHDGMLRRVSPQGYFYSGPVGILWEWARSSQDLNLGGDRFTIRNRAWQIQGSFMLTGEEAGYGAVVPRRSLASGEGGWGAFQVAVRAGRLKIDERAFPLLADPQTAASEARHYALAFSWYLNRSVRYTFDLGRTGFENAPGDTGKKPAENTIFSRVQFLF